MLATPLGLADSDVDGARSLPRASTRGGSKPSFTGAGGVEGGFGAAVFSVPEVGVGDDGNDVAAVAGGLSLPPPLTVT